MKWEAGRLFLCFIALEFVDHLGTGVPSNSRGARVLIFFFYAYLWLIYGLVFCIVCLGQRLTERGEGLQRGPLLQRGSYTTGSTRLSVGRPFLLHRSNKYFELPNYILLENGLIKKCASLSDLPGSAATLCAGVTQ